MSAIGTKRTFRHDQTMSAFGGKADMVGSVNELFGMGDSRLGDCNMVRPRGVRLTARTREFLTTLRRTVSVEYQAVVDIVSRR